MFERKVQPGDHVIDQGDDGDNFYVIDRYVWHFGDYDVKDVFINVMDEHRILKQLAQLFQVYHL